MRRLRGAFDRLSSFSALWAASRRARRGKRRVRGTAAFEYDLERELMRLEEELRDGSFRFSGYRTFTVMDPVQREIRAAPYRDRVVHHAICRELEPVIERQLVEESFACRVGKGTHRALDCLQQHLRRGNWVVKADVRKFFFAIDQTTLLQQLRRLYCDPRLDDLLIQLLATYDAGPAYAQGPGSGSEACRPRGLPIGNLTSQIFANHYLTPVDRYVKEVLGVRGYVRYMDDLVLVAPDRPTAQEWKAALELRLKALWLRPHPEKTQILPVKNGVRFLGFRVYRHHRRILRGNLQRFHRRMRGYAGRYGRREEELDRILRSLNAWLGCIGKSADPRFISEVLEPIRFQNPGGGRPWSFIVP